MSKHTHFTTVTPLPAGITRETVLTTLHNHVEMIDLNPLVIERHPIKPPREAAPEEINCSWYSVSDKIQYIPGLYQGKLTFNACFHDLADGMQSHIYAPMGLDMRGRWFIGGNLPGEPRMNVEMGHGIPKTGLYLREDIDMKCNFAMTAFVKKTTKKTHNTLVERLIEKSHVKEGEAYNTALKDQIDLRNQYPPDYHSSQSASNPGSPAPTPFYGDQKPPLQTYNSQGQVAQQGPPAHHRGNSYHLVDSKAEYIMQPQPSPGLAPNHAAAPAPAHPSHSSSSSYGGTQPYPPSSSSQGAYPAPLQPHHHPQAPTAPYPHSMMEMPGGTAGAYGNAHPGPVPPTQLSTNFSVELPSDIHKTPVELGMRGHTPEPPK